MRLILGFLTLAALSGQLNAQVTTTTVTATVLDPNKVPYANGRGTATHVSGPNSNGRNVGQVPFSMDANGAFTIRLLSNIGGGQWRFDICTPSVGTVSNCFNLTLTITGASQDISTALNAASAPMESAPFDGINSAFSINRNYGDYFGISPPPNPLAGYYRLYVNSGTGLLECKQASGATCLPSGSGLGSVTSVALTGPGGIFSVSGSPVTSTGTFGLTLAGNSGGITYFANGTTLASSATMPANTYIKGGGAGAAPSPGTILDDGSNPVQSPNGLTVLGSGYYYQIANANPGTSTNLLVCRNSIGRAITCATGTNHAVAGVAGQGAGNSGSVQVCIVGSCTVTFDNQSVVNDTAIPSPTVAGQVHDTGSMAQPAGVQSFLVTGTNAGVGTPTTIDVITPDSGTTGGFNNPMTTLCDEIVGGVAGAAVRLPCPTAVAGVPQLESSTPSGGIGQTKVWAPVGIIPRFSAGPTDTVAAADRAQIIDYTAATTVTIPQAGTTGFAGNYFTCVQVDKASLGNVTFTPTVSLLDNDSASLTLGPGQGTCFFTNNTNWFSRTTSVAQVNDLNTLGPNPWYDLRRYGLYGGAGGPLTVTTTAGSPTVTTTGIGDFVVGQGIEIPGAGVASTFPTWGVAAISGFSRTGNIATYSYTGPTFGNGQTVTIAGLSDPSFNGTPITVTGNNGQGGRFTAANPGADVASTASVGTATLTSAQVIVTQQGILNGSTTVAYKVALRGYHGEISAASNAGTTTTSAATIGINTVALSSCAIVSQVATCTTSSAHNFQAGPTIKVNIVSNGVTIDGEHVITATPSGTTFQFSRTGYGNSGTVSGGSASVKAKNLVQWNMQQYANLQALVYRSISGGAYSLIGVVQGMDGAFVDEGFGAPYLPIGAPTTPPASPVNGLLTTRITAINGSTLTLAANAVATVTTSAAQHDNTPVVYAACAAMTANGGTMRIPVAVPINQPMFNSPLDWRACPNQVELDVAESIAINDTWVMRPALTFRGLPGSNQPGEQFQPGGALVSVYGGGYPFFYWRPGNFGPVQVDHFSFNCNGSGQSCLMTDQDGGGGGVAGVNLDHIDFNGNGTSIPVLFKSGGFDYKMNRGWCQNTGSWGIPPCIQISTANSLGGQGALYTLASIMEIKGFRFAGTGIEFNDFGNAMGTGLAGNYTFDDDYIENPVGPFFTFLLSGVNSGVTNLTFNNVFYADFLGGQGVPMIQTANSRISGMRLESISCASSNQTLLEGSSAGTSGVIVEGSTTDDCGNLGITSGVKRSLYGSVSNQDLYVGYPIQLSQGSTLNYQMLGPSPPTAAVTAGGLVPVGAHTYQIAAIDLNGASTTLSGGVVATATGGNQTITVTPPALPAGAVGWRPYRDGTAAAFPGCSATPQGVIASTTPFVDTFGFACGGSVPSSNTAGSSVMGAFGIGSALIDIIGGGFTNGFSGSFSANRSTTLPDVSGTLLLGTLASLVTTAAASDNVTVAGATASSHCILTATNAAAATNIATTYVSAKTTNQITVTHTATANMNYDIACSPN